MPFLVLVIGVLIVVTAIALLRIHPFVALLVAAFVVGVLSPKPLTDDPDPTSAGRRAVQAVELTTQELGATAAGIAVVIALAAIIGQCLMESGAADKITRRLLALLGEQRAPAALLGSGYLLSIPVFFDTVFFLLVPLARALRMRTGAHYALYVMAVAGGAAITHSLVPPTPGPLLMVDNLSGLGLDLGTALAVGFLLGLPPAAIALLAAQRFDRRMDIPLREVAGSSHEQLEEVVRRDEALLPGFLASLTPVLLPVLLIAGATLLETLQRAAVIDLSDAMLGWVAFLGNKNLALFLAALFAALLLKRQKSLSLAGLAGRLEPALMSAGVIILITSAGGAFGRMLARVGIAEALREAAGDGALLPAALLVLAWGLAVTMKIAQGSGTVSMITASAMTAAIVGDSPLTFHPVYLYAAIGFGSMVFSWANDSGFWVVGKMGGLTEKETLLTWTRLLIVIGVAGLVEVLILSFLFPGR